MRAGGALILAGGRGRRIGQPKALLPFGPGCFLEAVLEQVHRLNLAWVGVVLPVELREHFLDLGPSIHRLVNLHPERGQLSSLHIGLQAGADRFPWLMVALVDQPAIASSTYQAVVDATEERASLWVPSYRGRRGHPVVFASAMYDDLRNAPAKEGARWAVARHRAARVEVEVDDPEVLLDVDTPADLLRLEIKKPS